MNESKDLLLSQAYIAKVLRKRRRAFLTGPEKIRVEKAKHKIRANLWVISLAFLFLFTGFHGLQNLQVGIIENIYQAVQKVPFHFSQANSENLNLKTPFIQGGPKKDFYPPRSSQILGLVDKDKLFVFRSFLYKFGTIR